MDLKKLYEIFGFKVGKYHIIPPVKRFRARYWLLASPILYFFGNWWVTSERKKFKKNLMERDELLKMKFDEFTSNFSIDQTLFMDTKTNELVNFGDTQDKYLTFFYGDVEVFFNLYKEFLEFTKKVNNIEFYFIFESEQVAKTFLRLTKANYDKVTFLWSESKNFGLEKNYFYALSPEKSLMFFRKIETNGNILIGSRKIIKELSYRINRFIDAKYIKRFEFSTN